MARASVDDFTDCDCAPYRLVQARMILVDRNIVIMIIRHVTAAPFVAVGCNAVGSGVKRFSDQAIAGIGAPNSGARTLTEG